MWTLTKYPSEMKQEKRAKFEDVHRPKSDTPMSTDIKFCFRGLSVKSLKPFHGSSEWN